MSLFEWKSEYSVSVERFDSEHKKLFSLINQLNDAMKVGQGRGKARHILEELAEYTRCHFEAEETAMRQASFSGLEEHIAEHCSLAGQLTELFAELDSNSGRLPMRLLLFLSSWLLDHIRVCDRKYIDALNAAGIR